MAENMAKEFNQRQEKNDQMIFSEVQRHFRIILPEVKKVAESTIKEFLAEFSQRLGAVEKILANSVQKIQT